MVAFGAVWTPLTTSPLSGRIVTLSRGCGGPLTLCSARRGQILSTDNISPLGAAARRPGRTSKAIRAWETGTCPALEEVGRRLASAAKTLATPRLRARHCPGPCHSCYRSGCSVGLCEEVVYDAVKDLPTEIYTRKRLKLYSTRNLLITPRSFEI